MRASLSGKKANILVFLFIFSSKYSYLSFSSQYIFINLIVYSISSLSFIFIFLSLIFCVLEKGKEATPFDSSVGNHRWFKYYENVFRSGFGDIRLLFGRYICREWNKRYEGKEMLWTFEITETIEMIKFDSPPVVHPPKVLWKHKCFDKKPIQ